MYAIEFETEIKNGTVKIPDQYERLRNGHARIVVLMEEEPDTPAPISFKNGKISAFKDQDGVAAQRELRDEW